MCDTRRTAGSREAILYLARAIPGLYRPYLLPIVLSCFREVKDNDDEDDDVLIPHSAFYYFLRPSLESRL